MSPQLLLPSTAARYGAKIHGEAVAHGKHYLYLIVDAADEASVRSYLAPFGTAGSLDAVGASRWETGVERGHCSTRLPQRNHGPLRHRAYFGKPHGTTA
jgi:hypothetical protein